MPSAPRVATANSKSNTPSVGTRLLASLSGTIPPVPVSDGYRLAMLVVAVVMLLLPLIYAGMIGAIGYGLIRYAGAGTHLLEGKGAGPAGFILYLVPFVAGWVLVLFMIKPLFVRQGRRFHPLTLTRQEQPLVYAYVEHLCDLVGAPRPVRIDVNTNVNASASFESSFGALASRKLVLTVGLPLVAALDLRQFSGVLAHEFGHFAQGTAMRLSFIVRTINFWFARLVYERDDWDRRLEMTWRRGGNLIIKPVVGIALLFIWITRKMLWLLMMGGHRVSSFMLREMEFDADRYEIRVAGMDCFSKTSERLATLSVATRAAYGDLDLAWRESRLCDDLPALICLRESQLPDDVRKSIKEHVNRIKTNWWDTHPCPTERLARAQKEAGAGVINVDGPATLLFKHFQDLSRRATVAFYHSQLGPVVRRENLVSTDSLEADRNVRVKGQDAGLRFFQGLVHPVRPVFFSRESKPPRDEDSAAEIILKQRSKLMEFAERARSAAKVFLSADEQLISIAQVRALQDCGEKADLMLMKAALAGEVDLISSSRVARQHLEKSRKVLEDLLAGNMRRLEVALWLESRGRPAPAKIPEKDDYGEYDLSDAPKAGSNDRLVDALRTLENGALTLEKVRQNFFLLSTLLGRLRKDNNPQPFVKAVIGAGQKLKDAMDELHFTLQVAPYPYEFAQKDATMAFVLVPGSKHIGETHAAAQQCLDSVYTLYMRILGDLAQRAEEVERVLGLEPLPEVKNESSTH
jgi:Zn-dependent protease with chaperone function